MSPIQNDDNNFIQKKIQNIDNIVVQILIAPFTKLVE